MSLSGRACSAGSAVCAAGQSRRDLPLRHDPSATAGARARAGAVGARGGGGARPAGRGRGRGRPRARERRRCLAPRRCRAARQEPGRAAGGAGRRRGGTARGADLERGRARLPAARAAGRGRHRHEREDDDRGAARRDAGRARRGERRPRPQRPRGAGRPRRARRLRALQLSARGRAHARVRGRRAAQPRARPPRPLRLVRGIPRRKAPDLRARAHEGRPARPRPRRYRVLGRRSAAGRAPHARSSQPRECRRGRCCRQGPWRRRCRARESAPRFSGSPPPARAGARVQRRPLRKRLEGDERRRRAAGARDLRARAAAPDPRRLAQGRGLRPPRGRAGAERKERPPDRRDRAPLARVRELRPVPRFRAPRRGVQEAGAEPSGVKSTQLESRLLILVTLGLVAFGLVMVYSATSASAALANGDPAYFLKRQAIYAVLGLVLMAFASRVDFRAVRRLAPLLVVGSLVLLLAVLAIGQSVNGARRWLSFGPVVFQPSELAKLALAVWAAAYLTRRRPPQRVSDLWRPLGLLTAVFCALLLAEPDLGTAIAIVLMLSAVILVAGPPGRTLRARVSIARALRVLPV